MDIDFDWFRRETEYATLVTTSGFMYIYTWAYMILAKVMNAIPTKHRTLA